MSDTAAKALALAALSYKESHDKGDYNEIANKPKLNGVQILGSHNSAYYKLPLLAETGHSITFETDSEYNLTIQLLNKAGDVISRASLDLPIEELVVDGWYEETSENKWLVLELHNGRQIRIPLEDLIDELATKEYVDYLYRDLRSRLDSEAQIREEQVVILNARIDSEAEIRQFVDDELLGMIDSERDARIAADSELEHEILEEVLNRAEADDYILDLLDSERDLRDDQYIELSFKIDSEGHTREQQFALFRQDLNNEIAARIAGDSELRQDLNLEIFNRTHNDLVLQANIDSEATIRFNKDAELENAIGIEAQTRSAQDVALSNRINQKQDIISATTPIVKLGNVIQLNYDPNTLKVEDNALKVIGGGGGTTAYLNGVLLDSEATTESVNIVNYLSWAEYQALDSEAKDAETIYMIYDSENDPLIQTTSYNRLVDKPQINGQVLSGNKSLASFGIQPVLNGTNPIRIAGNQVSLAYNEDQFYIGADNKLFYHDKVAGFVPDITFINNCQGIYGGINVNKYASGLYSGSVRFMSMNAMNAGTEYKVANAFGDGVNTFSSYCLGFDDLTYTPMCVKIENGEVFIYPTVNIPARSVIGFSFIASL